MSLDIRHNVDLTRSNTLGLQSKARHFIDIKCADEIPEVVAYAQSQDLPILWLGGGSNLVLANEIPAVVAKLSIAGVEQLESDLHHSIIKVGAGENWHGFVRWSIQQALFGLENLALIPGTVGAAPVQNIGAYGVEAARSIEAVYVYDTQSGCFSHLSASECEFGYRDSVFKRQPGRYVITHVSFRLDRTFCPNLSYAPLADVFAGVESVSALDLFTAVCQIRNAKLPNPKELANAGSFFKNPLVSESKYQQLSLIYPQIPAYPAPQGRKLAAGWLIEQAGLKGLVQGPVGVHRNQALVLVNYGGASRTDIEALAQLVKGEVMQRFGVELEQEPIPYP